MTSDPPGDEPRLSDEPLPGDQPPPGDQLPPSDDGATAAQEATAAREEVYGAAPERTRLAWQRTGLGVVVSCLLLFHNAVRLGVLPVGVAAVALGLVIAMLGVFAFPADRYLHGRSGDSWLLLRLLAAMVIALGVLGAAMAVISVVAT